MPETIAVIIGTYGDEKWKRMARVAMISAERQTHKPEVILHHHGETLARARNDPVNWINTEWLIFLDADDELDPGYCESILAGYGDIRYPRFRLIGWPLEDPNKIQEIPSVDITLQNFCVIGSAIRRKLFIEIGGFKEGPIWEDWFLWLKAWKSGAEFRQCRDAVYNIHHRPDSRNNSTDAATKRQALDEISRFNLAKR